MPKSKLPPFSSLTTSSSSIVLSWDLSLLLIGFSLYSIAELLGEEFLTSLTGFVLLSLLLEFLISDWLTMPFWLGLIKFCYICFPPLDCWMFVSGIVEMLLLLTVDDGFLELRLFGSTNDDDVPFCGFSITALLAVNVWFGSVFRVYGCGYD